MDKVNSKVEEWKKSNFQIFWAEIAPCQHLIQVYENEKTFLDTLEGFAGCGFLAGDSVIILATLNHLQSLDAGLLNQGFDLDLLRLTGQYIPFDATEILSRILVDKLVDESLFDQIISRVIQRAAGNNRKVRAFGELVSMLWSEGHCAATIQLENIWHRFMQNYQFTLYCAYPKAGFSNIAKESIDTICRTHSTVIDGQPRPATEIYYHSSESIVASGHFH